MTFQVLWLRFKCRTNIGRDPSNNDLLSPETCLQLFRSMASFEICLSVFLMEDGRIFNKTTPKKSSSSLTCVLRGNGRGHCITFLSLLGLFWDWSMLIHHQADCWVSECNHWPWGSGKKSEEWNEREFGESRQPRAILAPECMINLMTASFSLTA